MCVFTKESHMCSSTLPDIFVSQNPVSDVEIIKTLPDKEKVLFGMKLSKTLSTRASNMLGEWDIRFQYDKDAVAAEHR